MRLLANRYLSLAPGWAFDLSTAERVRLRRVRLRTDVERVQWIERCAGLMSVPRPSQQGLIDFGHIDGIGETEVVGPASVRPSRPAKREALAHSVTAALGRRLIGLVVELLDDGRSGEPAHACLDVPDALVGRVLTLAAAREARLRGFVPVSSAVLTRASALPPGLDARYVRDLLVRRRVLVIHQPDGPGTEHVLPRLALSLVCARPDSHVFLSVRSRSSQQHAAHVDLRTPERRVGLRAAEAPESYDPASSGANPGGDDADWSRAPLAGGRQGLPASDRDGARGLFAGRRLFQQVEHARALIARGRHAAGARLLQYALAAFRRRRLTVEAATVALELGRLRLARGRPAEAADLFERAQSGFAEGNADQWAVRAATFLGLARCDAGNLVESEAVLRTAVMAADRLPDSSCARFSRLALARCLLWENHPDEASRFLAVGPGSGTGSPSGTVPGARLAADEPVQDVAAAALAARISLARCDRASSCAAARDALVRADQSGRPLDLSVAHAAMAAVMAEAGDLTAVRNHVASGVAAARLARAPLRALRLRILLIEAPARHGRVAEALEAAHRLSHVCADRLPGLLAARLERARAGVARHAGPRSARHAPGDRHALNDAPTCAATHMSGAAFDELVDVLVLCHEIDDERLLLERVTEVVRARTRASSVAVFAICDEQVIELVARGQRSRPEACARRAIDSALSIGPSPGGPDVEVAAPIRYAGAVIGALAARWPIGADVPSEWITTLLRAVAAAIAPCVRAAIDRLALPPAHDDDPDLIGSSEAMSALRASIARAARAPFAVLIEGESGAGKELVARAVHRASARRGRRFCAVNCAALSDDLLEAELFGHARGAYTGAVVDRHGLFEEADGGTLLLDEVSELSPRAQAKLLRVVQEGEIRRLGENVVRPVDVRLVAATNRVLREEAERGRFRRDLLYRLDVIRLSVPPLRDRVEDIPALAAHFWRQAQARIDGRATLAPATIAALARYDWPGNVRELQNVIAALAVTAARRGSVGPAALPPALVTAAAGGGGSTLNEARRVFERRYVRAALARAGGNRGRAAVALGLSRQGLAKLVVRLDLHET